MSMPGGSDCIFCKIVRREAPASIVREDADTLAFMDIRPMNTGHVLVIPKGHAVLLEELRAGAAGLVFEAARRVSAGLRRSGLRCEAISMYLADGREAGQEVSHVHLHLIPRFAGDGFGLRPTPDYGRIASRGELEEIARSVRRAMGASEG
jgi:diadenosine tetraphosphate (Ap4A) HIT family hydrolase